MDGKARQADQPAAACTRRQFILQAAMGGGAVFLFAGLGCSLRMAKTAEGRLAYEMIKVDYQKCTGCRTCEAVCAAFNHPVTIEGKRHPGLANPHSANIRVYPFNPDADVPAVCAMCADAPCIAACPVDPDPMTGRKALYRHPETHAITHDPDRCIGCGACAEACAAGRVGVISTDPVTGRPGGICTLCGGDPQCVRHCPYGALSFEKGQVDDEFYGRPPGEIAKNLIRRWYGDAGREI